MNDSMDILKTTPEFLAEYMTYLLDFSRKPVETIKLITTNTAGTEQKVSGKLIGYLLLSVGVGFVINYIGVAAEMAPDNSKVVQLISRIEEKFLPVAVLVAIFVFASISHIAFIAVAFIQAAIGEDRFKGSIPGAVNAFTGFTAWSIPIIIAVLVIIRFTDAHTSVNPLIFLAFVLPMSVILPIYLIASLAAGYRIPVLRASYLFGTTVVLIVLATEPFR